MPHTIPDSAGFLLDETTEMIIPADKYNVKALRRFWKAR
jgi:hypothetical protein